MFNKLSCCTRLSYRGVSKAKVGTNLTGISTGRVRGLNPNDTSMGVVRAWGVGVSLPYKKDRAAYWKFIRYCGYGLKLGFRVNPKFLNPKRYQF